MKKFYAVMLVAVMFLAVPSARSEEKNWSDQAELSYVKTSGNSDLSTLSFKNELKAKFSEQLSSTWKLGALSGQNAGSRTAERFYTELRGDYLFTERLYSYLTVGWEKDSFAGIDRRIYSGPGAGYKLLLGPRHLLNAEAGLNYVSEKYTDDTNNDFLSGRLFGKYEFAFNDANKFSQSLEYLHDFEASKHYKIRSETAVTSALNSKFSLKVSYTVNYDHMPVPATLDHTDTILATALVANF